MYLSISDRIPPYPAISRHIPPYPAISRHIPPYPARLTPSSPASPRSGRRARCFIDDDELSPIMGIERLAHGRSRPVEARSFARRVRFAVSRFTDVVVNTSWGLRISSYPRVSPGISRYLPVSRHIPPYPAADTAKKIVHTRDTLHSPAVSHLLSDTTFPQLGILRVPLFVPVLAGFLLRTTQVRSAPVSNWQPLSHRRYHVRGGHRPKAHVLKVRYWKPI